MKTCTVTLAEKLKIQRIVLGLLMQDARNIEEFQPFVKFVIESDWYQGLVEYCKKHNKNIEQYLDKVFFIYHLDLGWVSAIVPMHINRIDVAYKTDKYQIWVKSVKSYIDNRL